MKYGLQSQLHAVFPAHIVRRFGLGAGRRPAQNEVGIVVFEAVSPVGSTAGILRDARVATQLRPLLLQPSIDGSDIQLFAGTQRAGGIEKAERCHSIKN